MSFIILEKRPLDTATKDWLGYLTGSPSNYYVKAVDAFVRGLKEDGNFTKLHRLWILATEQQQHARVSLVNPSSTQITEVNSPAWAQNRGYTGNGTTSYLNLNFTPSTDGGSVYTQDSASLFIYSRTSEAASGTPVEIGNTDGTRINVLRCRFTGNVIRTSINSAAAVNSSTTVSDSTGLFVSSRPGATTVELYRNGAQVGAAVASNSNGLPTNSIFSLCSDTSGTPGSFSTKQQAMIGIGGGNINQALLYNRINAFAIAIGFNV